MTVYQIKAVKLATSQNPSHYHIEEVFCAWTDAYTNLRVEGWMSRQDVAEQIDAGRATAFTHVGTATASVHVEHMGGKKYLRTVPDNTGKDNLLSLPKYYV